MRTLSIWAKTHARTTRVLFALGYFLLTSIGLLIGICSATKGVIYSEKTAWPLAIGVLLAMAFFPKREGRKDEKWAVWRRQRICHAAILAGAVALFVVHGNRLSGWANAPQNGSLPSVAFSSLPNFAPTQTEQRGQFSFLKKSVHRAKTFVQKTLVKPIFKSPQRSWGRFFKYLGLFLLVSGAVLLLSVFACNLACSGSEGGAAVVLVFAAIVAVFALFLLVKAFLSVPPGKVPDVAKPS